MKTFIKWAALIGSFSLLFTLTACAASPETVQAVGTMVQRLVADGALTPEQGQLIMDAISGGAWWIKGLEILGTIGGSLLGVKIWRGAATQRAGLPAEKVITK